MSQELIGQLQKCRKVSVPLLAVNTAEPASTVETIARVFAADERGEYGVIQWDCVEGLRAVNPAGEAVLRELEKALSGELQMLGIAAASQDPAVMLKILRSTEVRRVEGRETHAARLPRRTCVIMHNAHLFLEVETVRQALWNLRDFLSKLGACVILMGPHVQLPAELMMDVHAVDDPLPGQEELLEIVSRTYRTAAATNDTVEIPAPAYVEQCADGLKGLSSFAAKQACYLSMTPEGIVLEQLRDRMRRTVKQTRGLEVYTGPESFRDVGGLSNATDILSRVFRGPRRPRLVVWIEEAEKSFAGATTEMGDQSGTSQDAFQVVLTAMEDYKHTGMMLCGHPGTGKSLVAKACGNTFGVLCIRFDVNACKGRHVGESEQYIRGAMGVINAIAGPGGALFIGTCNKITTLPPELRRRFRLAPVMMFDLPTAEEQAPIWEYNLRQFGFWDLVQRGDLALPDSQGWTGADIRNCVENAYALEYSLQESAQQMAPICKTDRGAIQALRQAAAGSFLSASYAGLYQIPREIEGMAGEPLQGLPDREISFD